MAQKVYQGFYNDLQAGEVVTGADLRVKLVMSSTTCDTEDAEVLADFTLIDECDGVGYMERDLASVALTYDASNLRLEYDATDADMDGGGGSIAAPSRAVTGYVIYRWVDGTDANDVPWAMRDIGPYEPSGGTFDIIWNGEGVIQIGSA